MGWPVNAVSRANEIAIARAVLARTRGSKPGCNAPAALVTAPDPDSLSARTRAMMMLPDR